MNLHLYKVIKLDDYSNEDDLEKTQVMTEKDLRKEFDWALNHGKIPHEMLEDYQNDPDYAEEDWEHPETNLKIGTIIDIMNDICNYTCGDGYYILETDIDVELNRNMVDRWLDVLNYWFEHIEDMGDRYPDMQPMVNKFDKVIDEIYRLTKGE